jgi:hypothetical protein
LIVALLPSLPSELIIPIIQQPSLTSIVAPQTSLSSEPTIPTIQQSSLTSIVPQPSLLIEPTIPIVQQSSLPSIVTLRQPNPVNCSINQRSISLTIDASSHQYPFPESQIHSPQIPSPSHQLGIPETPQRTLAHVGRPFGSLVRPMQNLDEARLHPDLRTKTASSTYESASTRTADEDDDLGILSDDEPPLEPGDATNKRRKRPRLTAENVEFQTNKRKRELYYRVTAERLRTNFEILGIHTGCIGILYLHR